MTEPRKPRKASWRELPPAEMAAHLLATPTIADGVWTSRPRRSQQSGGCAQDALKCAAEHGWPPPPSAPHPPTGRVVPDPLCWSPAAGVSPGRSERRRLEERPGRPATTPPVLLFPKGCSWSEVVLRAQAAGPRARPLLPILQSGRIVGPRACSSGTTRRSSSPAVSWAGTKRNSTGPHLSDT